LAAPVIAAVHGVAFGAGQQLALGAEMRYAAPGTRLSVMEVQWGLAPDMGGMALMRRLVRDDLARELTYTGRIFSAEEALSYGLVTRVCDDPLSAAVATAREIAEKSPHAVQAAKRLFNYGCEPELAEMLTAESAEHDALVLHPNQPEAVAARAAKRAPHFSDPK
jgi:enoyl-CoA hydratase/carnithine racemase